MRTFSITVTSLILLSFALLSCQDGSTPFNPDVSEIPARSSIALQTAVIGNYGWHDENMDGLQGEEETGIGGITVNLYDCEENMIASTTTNEEGHYHFELVETGEYMLGFEAPDGYQFSPQDEGDDDAIDSDPDPENGMTECFDVEPDSENLIWDAGMFMMADDDCTYGKGFWKNHCGIGPQDDLVSELLPLWLGDHNGEYSIHVETAEMAYEILDQDYGHPSNGMTKLYAHFLTAKLNIANDASHEDIAELIDEVDGFLAEYDWESWGELDQERRQMINDWKGTLEDYNEGEIGPGSCHDYMVN